MLKLTKVSRYLLIYMCGLENLALSAVYFFGNLQDFLFFSVFFRATPGAQASIL